jgi:hypothetical protein
MVAFVPLHSQPEVGLGLLPAAAGCSRPRGGIRARTGSGRTTHYSRPSRTEMHPTNGNAATGPSLRLRSSLGAKRESQR